MAARLELLKEQFFDDSGSVLSGGKLYTYIVGTTTAKATYTTALGDVEQANPVVLDSAGRVPSDLYGVGAYKIVITNSAGTTIDTIPTVSGVNSNSMTVIGDYSNDFDAAITAISSTATTLYVNATATMSANVTVPATCTVVIEKGGSINQASNTLTFNGPLILNGGTITNNATLTMNGPVRYDGGYTVFTSTSYGTFGAGAIRTVYPEMWGVNTTPGTTDMTAEIQAALDSGCKDVQGVIGSIYLISSTLTVPTGVKLSNAYIKAAADFGNNHLITNETTTPGNDAARDIDIILENLKIDGNRTNNSTGTTSHGIALTSVVNAKVTKCNIISPKGDGIYLGIYSTVSNANVQIYRNRVYDCNRNGIACVGGSYIFIENNYVDTTITNHGIDIEPDASGDITKYIKIENNIIYNTENSGIALTANNLAASDMEAWSANGNIIISPVDATYGYGINVNGVTCQTSVSHNKIYDAGVDGIYLDSTTTTPSNINMVGNLIKNADRYGYYGQGDKCSFVGNTVYADANTAILINIADDNIVNGNLVYQTLNTGYGIDIAGAGNRNVVVGNELYGGGTGNNSIGIAERQGTDDFIEGNTCVNFGYGIRILSTAGRTVRFGVNHVNGNGTDFSDDRTETAVSVTLEAYGGTSFDTTSNAIAATLGSGEYVGQIKTLVLTTDGGTDVTLTVTNHVTSDPEIFTLDDVDDTLVLVWNGTEWHTVLNAGCATP